MSFVSSNNCSDFFFFDGANVLGSEKRLVWWIYNGSAMFKMEVKKKNPTEQVDAVGKQWYSDACLSSGVLSLNS